MSKFVGFIIGGIEIGLGVVAIVVGGATFNPALVWAGWSLAGVGVATVLKNVGTLIQGSAADGSAVAPLTGGATIASRNPIAPHLVIYGRTVVGGTIVFINEFGDDNKFLDLIIVLACHPCQAVDALLFDKQIIQMSTNGGTFTGIGDSFTPLQQTISIKHISRTNGVVTCQLPQDIPLLVPGDYIGLQNITGDRTLNGRFTVAEVPTHSNSFGGITFTYLSGGLQSIVDNEGQAVTLWPDYGKKIHMEVLLGHHAATFPGMLNGTPVDQDFSNIVNPSPNPWTSQHLLLGLTSVFLRLHFNDVYFARGLPTISFLVRGKTDIYDPRAGAFGAPNTSAYTENAALCIADYLSNTKYGFRAAYGSEIPLPPLIAAANACDEDVFLAAGGKEPRYALNGKFELTAGRGAVLRSMLTACAGRLSYQGGQFIIWPAVWTGTAVGIAPGIGQMTGPFQWKGTSVRDLYNGVKGTFITPANSWQPGDIPPYAQDSTHGYSLGAPWSPTVTYGVGVHVVYQQLGYVSIAANTNYPPDQHPETWALAYQDINLTEDNGERRWLDVQLPFTISPCTAQRLCKIELLRRRHFVTATFRFNMAGYAMTVMDAVQITAPVINWTNNTVEVLAHRFTMDRQNIDGADVPVLGTEVDVQETDASVYDWSQTEELTAQGYQQPVINLVLPKPPTNLTLESDTATTTVTASGALADTILIRWTKPDDAYVMLGGHIEIRYQELQDYDAGTVAVTQGSAHVAGIGTAWVPAMDGGQITINGVTYEILTVDAANAITLTAPYAPPTSPRQAYFISYGDTWIGLPSVQPSVEQVNLVKVTDGLSYIVEVRSVNSGGFPSVWVEAGPITASGAKVPLPLRPFSQFYPLAAHGYGFSLKQVQGSDGTGPYVDISGTPPVNTFSTVAAPVIDPFGVTSANPSGDLPIGDGVAQVFGIDGAGLRTAGSGYMEFTVLDTLSSVTFGMSFAPGTTGYEMFLGPNAGNLIGQGAQSGTPGAFTFISMNQIGYGPPDPRAVKLVARGKRCVHGGIVGTTVASSTDTTVVINIPGVPTVNEFAQRYLIVTSHAGLPETQPFAVIGAIVGNDAGSPHCTLTVPSPNGLLTVAGDVVMITTMVTSATLTSITDAGWQNPFAPGGLNTTGEEIGNIIRILFDASDATYSNDTATVIGNTATGHSTTPFKRAPGVGSIFIVEEPSWFTGDIVTSIMQNATAPSLSAGPNPVQLSSIPVGGLGGDVALVELLVQDRFGNNSPESADGFRMLYVMPDPAGEGAGAGGYYNITPVDISGTLTAVIDLNNGFTQHVVIHAAGPHLNMGKPVFTGGTMDQGLEFTLLVDEDGVGGAPIPIFPTGAGAYAADVGGWQIDGTKSTRTTYFFQLTGSAWGLKVSPPSTGGPIT